MYRIDVVNADRQTIDRYLGSGEYDNWAKLKSEVQKELADHEKMESQLPPRMESYLSGSSDFDADMAWNCTNQIDEAIRLIQASRAVDKNQLQSVMDTQSAALEALKSENDAMEAVLAAGLFADWMNFEFQNIQYAAVDAYPKVVALKKALAEAKSHVAGAVLQTVLDTGIAIATFFLPEIAVLTKIALAVGQWVTDDYLGGNRTTPFRDNLSTVNSEASTAAAASQAIPNWNWLKSTKEAGKTAGNALTFTGLYFDQDEIRGTLNQVQIVQAALNESINSLKRLQGLVERQKPAMFHLKMQLVAAGSGIRAAKEDAATSRTEWQRLAKAAQIPDRGLMKWRY